MRIRVLSFAFLLLISSNLLAGGAKFVKTWKNPDAQPVNWKGQKVAAFAITLLVANRDEAERILANELTQKGAQGVPGHTLVAPKVEQDREAVKRILADAGITGAVVMRVVDVKQEAAVKAGTPIYAGASSASFYGYLVGYVPGTIDPKTTVMVETLVYSIEQDKLLWSGTSKTTDPRKVDEVIKKLANAAGSEIRKAGIVKR